MNEIQLKLSQLYAERARIDQQIATLLEIFGPQAPQNQAVGAIKQPSLKITPEKVQLSQTAVDLHKSLKTPPELTTVNRNGEYRGKKATIVTEYIGNKIDKDTYYEPSNEK